MEKSVKTPTFTILHDKRQTLFEQLENDFETRTTEDCYVRTKKQLHKKSWRQ